jgi:tetratricopeptide (TPR) repeat protein
MPADPGGRLVSTFINPNHQALFFAVPLFLALGLVLRPATPARDPKAAGPAWTLERLLRRGALLLAAATLGGALVLTGSRGGLLGLVAGLVTVLLLSLYGRAVSRAALAVVAVLLIGTLVATWFGADVALRRVSSARSDAFADVRWVVYDQALRMLGDAPWLGFGLGTFADAFPFYRPAGVPADKLVDFAHNDYLQLAAETGGVGIVILGWALGGLVLFTLRRWLARHDPFVRGLTVGALGALAALAVHSVLDFGLHMPANALQAVVVLALLPAVVALRTQRGAGGGVDLPTWTRTLSRPERLGAVAATVVGLALVGVAVVPPALADGHLRRAERLAGPRARIQGAVVTSDLVSASHELQQAARLDPRSPAIRQAQADVTELLGRRIWAYGVSVDGKALGRSPAARLAASQAYLATAHAAYQQALAQRPRDAVLHGRYGRFLAVLDGIRETVRGSATVQTALDPRIAPLIDGPESLLPRALEHMRESVRWDPTNPYAHQDLAFFALTTLRGASARPIVVDGLRSALAIEPTLLKDTVRRLLDQRAPLDLLYEAMPRRLAPWLSLAWLLDEMRRPDDAAGALERALDLAPVPADEAQVRLAMSRSRLRAGDGRAALAQARQALVLTPKSHEAYGRLAEVYIATGKHADAAEALASAIGLLGPSEAGERQGYQELLALEYTRLDRLPEAIVVRREQLRQRPGDVAVQVHLAVLLDRTGQAEGSVTAIQAAERLAPENTWVRGNAMDIYGRQGRLADAVQAGEALVRVAPFDAERRVQLAGFYARLGQRERAVQEYRKVLAGNPGHEGARRALAALGLAGAVPAPRSGASS